MWAKRAGFPPWRPLKTRRRPRVGEGRWSGKTTEAQKRPEPTRASEQLARARSVEPGWTWGNRQTGRPLDCRRPWRLTLTVIVCSCGGRAPSTVPTWPLRKTAIGAGVFLGSFGGSTWASTVTRRLPAWITVALATVIPSSANPIKARAPARLLTGSGYQAERSARRLAARLWDLDLDLDLAPAFFFFAFLQPWATNAGLVSDTLPFW